MGVAMVASAGVGARLESGAPVFSYATGACMEPQDAIRTGFAHDPALVEDDSGGRWPRPSRTPSGGCRAGGGTARARCRPRSPGDRTRPSSSSSRSRWCSRSAAARGRSPGNGKPMGRQHEGLGGKLGVVLRRSAGSSCSRIAFGLARPHRDVGADLGQHHIAGDQHAQLLAIQRSVLRCVSVAHDHTPLAPPMWSTSPIQHAPERGGWLADGSAVECLRSRTACWRASSSPWRANRASEASLVWPGNCADTQPGR